MKKHESASLSYSDAAAVAARHEIFDLMRDYPGTPEETERSLGLFLRGSMLARILGVDEVYRMIVRLPGVVLDVGTWRGQTAVLCENLRAIHEPLNFNRRIVCFDTFEGYAGFSRTDRPTEAHREGSYSLGGARYSAYLEHLLALHERSNAMGHNHGKHRVVSGDCRKTVPKFFKDSPNEVVALAFVDLNAYEPTRVAVAEVWSRLVPGGVVAFWQLTRSAIRAEGLVYAESILPGANHDVSRSVHYPGLCFVQKR